MDAAEAKTRKVRDIMSTDVEFIAPSVTVREVATLMGEIEVGAVPVGTAGEMEGIITDRDILYRVVAKGLSTTTTFARDVMSRPVVSCRPDDSLRAAMDLMAANHIRRMPVRAEGGEVTGWITLADVARHLLVESDALQSTLHQMTETDR